jgi:hypothetical protein
LPICGLGRKIRESTLIIEIRTINFQRAKRAAAHLRAHMCDTLNRPAVFACADAAENPDPEFRFDKRLEEFSVPASLELHAIEDGVCY